MRTDGRKADQLRSIEITCDVQKFASGSAWIKWGETQVLCAVSVEDSVPAYLKGGTSGWITSEYNMLPCSTQNRKPRRQGGRETEIKRLIGRSLRAAVDLSLLGQRTFWVDCDVIQADGGTRVASITAGYVALAQAIEKLRQVGAITKNPLIEQVAAVSVGIVEDQMFLDLPYAEDSHAEVDFNLVMTASGKFVEIQGTAERKTFNRDQLQQLCDFAWIGIKQLCDLQTQAISTGVAKHG